MGLIKRNQLEESGTLLIDKPAILAIKKRLPPEIILEMPSRLSGEGIAIPKAKDAAEKIIDQAYLEAENIREQAKEEGRLEGRDEAATNIAEALETLNQATKERKRIIKDAEPEILRLSLKVAEQIIRSEVSLHRDVCLNIVSEAIGRVSDREQILIKVNREDAEYLKRYKDRLTGMLDGVKSFSIIEDANVEAGGCVIETNLGFIDARISTKLQSIEEALKKVE